MFREMRKIGIELPKEEAIQMLKTQSHGTLALDGDEGYPYAVPVNFAYYDNKIIFHGATSGHKLDAIKRNAKASFCVIAQDSILPAEFNSLYRSAIAFGKIRILETDEERRMALRRIIQKYSAEFAEGGEKYIDAEWDNVTVMELEIEHLTGKAGD